MIAARLDVADLSLVEAADAVRKGEVSAVSLLEACLANLDSHEEAVNATIWVDKEAAFTAARAADAKRGRGVDRLARCTGCRWRTRTCTIRPAVSPVAGRPFAAISCRTTARP